MVRQTLQWEEDGIDLIDEISTSSSDNKSLVENFSEPIAHGLTIGIPALITFLLYKLYAFVE